jgi:hypothetical protein
MYGQLRVLSKELAEYVLGQLLECSGALDRSVGTLQGAVDDKLYARHRLLVGRTLAEFYDGVMRDVFKQYPDLEPDSFKVGSSKDA